MFGEAKSGQRRCGECTACCKLFAQEKPHGFEEIVATVAGEK